MTALFAVSLIVGVGAILLWIALSVVATSVDGWEQSDPETRFGAKGRATIAAVTGFGMGGISATYAGWSNGFVIGASLVGAAVMAVAAAKLGQETETE